MAKKNNAPKNYSDFTIQHLRDMFGLIDRKENLTLNKQSIQPSEWLLTTISYLQKLPQGTEKAKSELRITPILVELHNRNETKFTYFSGYSFEVDEEKALKGRCDFLLIKDATSVEINAPIIGIFEAKDDNIDRWIGQCGAEMYAAQLLNQRENVPIEIIYGAVTNGFEWLFLRLEKNILQVDTQRYSTDNLPRLLGALQSLIDFYA